MTRRKPPRVRRFLQPCPDCAAQFEGSQLQHEPTCPLANGVDDQCDDDRRFFAANPSEWTRTRPIARAEYQTLLHVDPARVGAKPLHVHVIRQPWGQLRQFCNGDEFVSIALDPDEEAS